MIFNQQQDLHFFNSKLNKPMSIKTILLSSLALFSITLNAADTDPEQQNFYNPEPQPASPYDLSYPYAYFELDEIVKNISGLTASSDLKTVTCIQSEDGKAYQIDRKTGKIAGSVFFVTEAEFQGIEMVGDTMFAIKENGQLYKIWNLKSANKSVKQVRTGLPRTELIEGLGYDLQNNRLLFASKGAKEGEFSRKIYEFDVKTNTTNPIPAYEISLANIKGFLTDKKTDKNYSKLHEDFVAKANPKGIDFTPTSVAVHPFNNNIYVLSALNNTIVVMNQGGEIVDMTKLKKDQHIAPSGICFDEEGTMYISNEAKDGKPAKILEYKMQKTALTASRK
jgi:uncharacterized protein YjiK